MNVVQRAYLAGLYEGEGCVWLSKDGYNTQRVRVTISMTNKTFIDYVKKRLEEEEIKTSFSIRKRKYGLGNKIQYRLDINDKGDVEKFFEIIPTSRLRSKYKKIKSEDTRKRKKHEA